ncbi:hypothetical protein ACI2K4_03865 [Micromonospora sp. NPDC050397]|uniref:hypothetical protein n=1 Tax=Micromonospora sp. NPDC050397 TaxID=3364279 RepID=UPI00384FECF2
MHPLEETTLETCVDRLVAGQVVGVSTDRVVLEGVANSRPGANLVVSKDFLLGHEAYGIGLPNNFPRTCAFLNTKIKEFILDHWQQKFRDNLADFATPEGRMPDPNGLDPCEPED